MNSTSSSGSIISATAGVIGAYDGNGFGLKVIIILFACLAMYNAVELLLLVFMTFSRYRGLYFWSLVISSLSLIPYSLGMLFKFFNILTGKARWVSIGLLTLGWYPMVTGQSVILWSRLHLIVSGERGRKILKYTKWMIIVDAVILHIPTTVMTFGSNGTLNTAIFVDAYNIMEKIQMIGFLLVDNPFRLWGFTELLPAFRKPFFHQSTSWKLSACSAHHSNRELGGSCSS
jgi:hypothetical protein